MIVHVDGLLQFVGHKKRMYRDPPRMSDNPEQHHAAFAEQLEDATLVDSGVTSKHQADLVAGWEADPRTLVADMVTTRDGRISYRLYEIKR